MEIKKKRSDSDASSEYSEDEKVLKLFIQNLMFFAKKNFTLVSPTRQLMFLEFKQH